MTETELFEEAIHQWGIDSQLNMATEECAELIHAVCKYKRFHSVGTLDRLNEEVADVQLMLDQLKTMIPEIGYAQRAWRRAKLERLATLLGTTYQEVN